MKEVWEKPVRDSRKSSLSKPDARRPKVELGALEHGCHVGVGRGRGEVRLRAKPAQDASEQDGSPHQPRPPTPGGRFCATCWPADAGIALRQAPAVQGDQDGQIQKEHQHDEESRLASSQLRHDQHGLLDRPVKCTQRGCATEQETKR